MGLPEILTLLFGQGLLITIGGIFYRRIKAKDRKEEAVCLGVQALLRDRLIEAWHKWEEKGYAPIYAKENFENMWKQYHNLGVNGVMDETHEKFMKLPERRIDDES